MPEREKLDLGRVLLRTLESAAEADRNAEPANVADGLFAIARAIIVLADAVSGCRDGGSIPEAIARYVREHPGDRIKPEDFEDEDPGIGPAD